MSRSTANIYPNTKSVLEQIKKDYKFKSDDQLINYLCNMFLQSQDATAIQMYLQSADKDRRNESSNE